MQLRGAGADAKPPSPAEPPRPRAVPQLAHLAGLQPTETIPDALSLGQRFLPDAPSSRIVTRLHALLSSIDASWELEAQLDWLERLSDWLHRRGWPRSRRQTSLHLLQDVDARTLHLELLVNVLEQVAPWQRAFSQLLQAVLDKTQATGLFTDVGLAQEPGFWREATSRLSESLLPRPPDFNKMSELLLRVLPQSEDARWLPRVPRPLFARLLELLQVQPAMVTNAATGGGAWGSLRYSIHEAVIILASRVCALGLANDVRERMPETTLADLPFLRLRRACDGLLDSRRTATSGEASGSYSGTTIVEAFVIIQECRQAVQQVLGHLEDYGVSVDLVYRLELINAQVGRIEALLGLLFARRETDDESGHEVAQFVAELIEAQTQRHSLRALFRTSTQQLSRKIVERTGKSGEKYITETPAEWRQMLLAGCGGGLLTAGTALLKYLLSGWKLPAFFAGVVASSNYALSFVIIQLCHFTLATKQPSMTAAALAAALSQRGQARDKQGLAFDRLVDMIARITRSQMASAVGNLGAVIPAALLCDWLWRLRTGHNFLSPASAAYTVHSMHPLIALPFAALTGVYLWLSSIAAGWLENWTVYHHLPAGIAGSRRIRRLLGARVATWLGQTLERQVAGIGGVVTLGFLLGMSPVIGQFFGLPTEVRHVTLSSGSLALAAATDVMQSGARILLSRDYVYAAVGIVFILAANFGVSFTLALWVALRARGVRSRELVGLLRSLLSRLWRSPLEFVFPVSSRSQASGSQPPA